MFSPFWLAEIRYWFVGSIVMLRGVRPPDGIWPTSVSVPFAWIDGVVRHRVVTAVGHIQPLAGLIDLNLGGRVVAFVIGRQRRERLNLLQAGAVHLEDADLRIGLVVDVQKLAIRMQLQSPRPRAAGVHRHERRIGRHRRALRRIDAVDIHAIEPELGDIRRTVRPSKTTMPCARGPGCFSLSGLPAC